MTKLIFPAILGPRIKASGGNSVYTSGDYRIHKFTSSGTFTIDYIRNPGNNVLEYFVVGGGGGGGGSVSPNNGGIVGGGGGAGGYKLSNIRLDLLTKADYAVTVGMGTNEWGNIGDNSLIKKSGAVAAIVEVHGGGTGGSSEGDSSSTDGYDGASGGGGCIYGLYYDVTNGGASIYSGEGGSAGETPPESSYTAGAGGGSSYYTNFDGTWRYYANPGLGGEQQNTGNGNNGQANTGNGGEGGGTMTGLPNNSVYGGQGGSGIVIIRYKVELLD